jgi:hypothetical protein
LRGSTVSALRDDAKQMRDELGLEPLDEHDDRGRHRDQGGSVRAWRARHELDHPSSERSIVNDEIRRAAGRRVEPVIADPPHAGDVGIGRGAGSAPQPVHDDVVVTFNKQIRLSAGVVRGRYPVDLIASL